MDALWQLLSSHSNGNIYTFLDQIIHCIHENTGSHICVLVAEHTESGFTNHRMHAGKNVLGHDFANFCPQLSGEWESFVRSLSETSKCKDDELLLGEYVYDSKNQDKKLQLRTFFHNVLDKKLASECLKFNRLPWGKLCANPDLYILPGCLPYGFQLKDPELLRVDQIAELWKHLYQHQQLDSLMALHFADEVFKFATPSASDKETERDLPKPGRLAKSKTGLKKKVTSEEQNGVDRAALNMTNTPEKEGSEQPVDDIAGASMHNMHNEALGHRARDSTISLTQPISSSGITSVDRLSPNLPESTFSLSNHPLNEGPVSVEQESLTPAGADVPINRAQKISKVPSSDIEDSESERFEVPKRKVANRYIPESSSEPEPNPDPDRTLSLHVATGLSLKQASVENDMQARGLKRRHSTPTAGIEESDSSVGPKRSEDPDAKRKASTSRVGNSFSKFGSAPDWKCPRCNKSFPKSSATMHRRICTTVTIKFDHPPGNIHRNDATDLFACPKCGYSNKNSDKVRANVKQCFK